MPALFEPLRLQMVVAPYNVCFGIALNCPGFYYHNVAGAHPDVSAYFAGDAAHSLLAVFALHLKPPPSDGLNYGAKHLILARKAHPYGPFLHMPPAVPLPGAIASPACASPASLRISTRPWHIITLFYRCTGAARLAYQQSYPLLVNDFCIRAGAFIAYNINLDKIRKALVYLPLVYFAVQNKARAVYRAWHRQFLSQIFCQKFRVAAQLLADNVKILDYCLASLKLHPRLRRLKSLSSRQFVRKVFLGIF